MNNFFRINSIVDLLECITAILAVAASIYAACKYILKRWGSKNSYSHYEYKLLNEIWGTLDKDLQKAFILAGKISSIKEENIISTSDLFRALVILKNDSISLIFNSLPNGCLPEPNHIDLPVDEENIDKKAHLSKCIYNSLNRFDNMKDNQQQRQISTADIFVDIAKYGNGSSVKKLREYGVNPEFIDSLVTKLKLDLIKTESKLK